MCQKMREYLPNCLIPWITWRSHQEYYGISWLIWPQINPSPNYKIYIRVWGPGKILHNFWHRTVLYTFRLSPSSNTGTPDSGFSRGITWAKPWPVACKRAANFWLEWAASVISGSVLRSRANKTLHSTLWCGLSPLLVEKIHKICQNLMELLQTS